MQHLAQHTFSATPQTVRAARDFTMQTLDSWGGCLRRDDIRTCVSELAGNAVQHGSPESRDYLLRLIRHPHCLHIEVHDGGGHSPVRIPPASLSAEAGRGMRIVQELCDDWGVQALTGTGKAVWTCFHRPEAHTSRCSCTP
ncbi:ATP-binding protein [Streptomyces chiangmaiensis]|uniref:ATP-binding protein n=1 Tax=Streptomyces chiangmaiensis TaxID=766497 RepID=A0ABU7FTA4_9ACTN|nr:ATP-binding protein [Streptomyces chiangmaiensis]MED7826314.1 ATP-binding protein [Streptomyces chiangmaiensis]